MIELREATGNDIFNEFLDVVRQHVSPNVFTCELLRTEEIEYYYNRIFLWETDEHINENALPGGHSVGWVSTTNARCHAFMVDCLANEVQVKMIKSVDDDTEFVTFETPRQAAEYVRDNWQEAVFRQTYWVEWDKRRIERNQEFAAQIGRILSRLTQDVGKDGKPNYKTKSGLGVMIEPTNNEESEKGASIQIGGGGLTIAQAESLINTIKGMTFIKQESIHGATTPEG